jgi:hypothetical protein
MVAPNVENITAIPYIVRAGEQALYVRMGIPRGTLYYRYPAAQGSPRIGMHGSKVID